jgi:hypothetical protein
MWPDLEKKVQFKPAETGPETTGRYHRFSGKYARISGNIKLTG